MTNQEVADRICSGQPVRVSMSKEGIFLTVGDRTEEISAAQAEIVWDALPKIMGALPAQAAS